MKSAGLMLMLCLLGCALMRKTDKVDRTAQKEITKQTYLDKVDVKNTGKEIRTFTWWNDSTVYQYQSVREQVDELKGLKLTAKEDTSVVLKQREKRVEAVPVFGTLALIGLMIVLYILYKRFFA